MGTRTGEVSALNVRDFIGEGGTLAAEEGEEKKYDGEVTEGGVVEGEVGEGSIMGTSTGEGKFESGNGYWLRSDVDASTLAAKENLRLLMLETLRAAADFSIPSRECELRPPLGGDREPRCAFDVRDACG